jgi:putative membrane protein
MQSRPLYRFLIRWFVSGLGLWIAANILSSNISYNRDFAVIVIAGLILAILNTFLKPLLILLSLPALILSLGLFMIIINGIIVYLASKLYSGLNITNFWAAVFAGMVIGLVNYLVSTILADKN